MLLIITISTFVCITFGVMALYWLVYRPQSAATERLKRLGQTNQTMSATAAAPMVAFQDDRPVTDLAERIAAPLHRLAPPSAAEAHKLQKLLMHAGYRSPSSPVIYRAIQLFSLVLFPGAIALVFAFLAWPLSSAIVWLGAGVLLGFFLPRFVLDQMIKGRKQRVRWGLADALDLMVVSIEAGLGLNAAMLRVSDELKDVHKDISDEFELANLEIKVGRDRDEALRNMAERTGVDDLRSLVAMLIQADRFGTSIARAVRIFSDSLRTKRRQRAEQAAQKAAVKLLFPLACFLFPVLFIAILGPAMLTIVDTFSNM
ncbi:MAG TPA: type II secretion system F family protein [Pyrinomonadaceae bacterium]|nr:type II secretion system F family protein [Pyrinomonadaceae bacterium]